MLSSKSKILRLLGRVVKREMEKCALHPLILTLLIFTVAQDIENKKSGAEAPHGLSKINRI